MKTTTKLLYLIIALALFSNCAKDDCDKSTKNLNVDKSYLPYIIPYSDSSTRLFLKNGKDTLLFKSQGLNESIEIYKEDNTGVCRTYYLQKLSLTMAASDSDYFKMEYFTKFSSSLSYGLFTINGHYSSKEIADISLEYYYPPILKLNVLNNVFDTINSILLNNNEKLYFKPYLGIVKIETPNLKYELIK